MKQSLKWAAISAGAAGVVAAAFVGGHAWAGGIPATGALTYSGLLQDAKGVALAGPEYMEVQFWNDPTATAATNLLCDTGTPTVTPLVNGHFSIPLPDTCTTKVGSNAGVYVDIIVGPTLQGATSLGTRVKIGAVPFAVEANHAVSADSATGASGGLATSVANLQGNITAWGIYTPILHTSSSATQVGPQTTQGYYRRVGDSVEIEISTTFGTNPQPPDTGYWVWSLPPGVSFDGSKGVGVGVAHVYTSIGTSVACFAFPKAGGVVGNCAGNSSSITSGAPVTFGLNDSIVIHISFPVVGWSVAH